MNSLGDVWRQQDEYNARVMKRQYRPSAEWMETYILGMMSECGQLLEAMRWKKNRLQHIHEFTENVPQELADITKYAFSMWILMGYSPEEMLDLMFQKGILLDQLYTQEFETNLQRDVVVFDLDNVLADTQTALAEYFEIEGFDTHELNRSIHLDLAVHERFDRYREIKNRFEREGGYANIDPIFDLVELMKKLRRQDYSIVVYTARPIETFKRIRWDTFNWFSNYGSLPDLIKFGREERISWTAILQKKGHRIVLVEDDPSLIKRARICGIPLVVPYREYNKEYSTIGPDCRTEELIAQIVEKINGQPTTNWKLEGESL